MRCYDPNVIARDLNSHGHLAYGAVLCYDTEIMGSPGGALARASADARPGAPDAQLNMRPSRERLESRGF